MPSIPNLRTTDFSNKGKDVSATKQLDGVAKDSLSGKNSLTQYTTSGGGTSGHNGGTPSNK